MKNTKKKTNKDLTRLAHNFFMEKAKGNYAPGDVNTVGEFYKYADKTKVPAPKKVLLMFICTNPRYWQYIHDAIATAKEFFLPGHNVDYLLFSDWSKEQGEATMQQMAQSVVAGIPEGQPKPETVEVPTLNKLPEGLELIPIDAMEWPYPTLLRYHTMLNEKERLLKYDAVYYCDIDMRFVNFVGDEVLNDNGLTLARHPMYALKKNFIPPYEPNKDSVSFIPRPGRVVVEDGKPRFDPVYIAGGFQGGETKAFIELMEACKDKVEKDMDNNYIPIWNDESVLNSVMFENQEWLEKAVILSPSYIYPDSLVKNPDGSPGYYEKLWGKAYTPRLVTLTKPFTIKPLTEEEQKNIHG